jgi:hypothetical protein
MILLLQKMAAQRLAVVGSRSFSDFETLTREIDLLRLQFRTINSMVSGGAAGADKLAEKYATLHQIPILVLTPDWNTHGKRAGILRNYDIIAQGDIVIAFWDQKSPGTKHSIDLATTQSKILRVVHF